MRIINSQDAKTYSSKPTNIPVRFSAGAVAKRKKKMRRYSFCPEYVVSQSSRLYLESIPHELISTVLLKYKKQSSTTTLTVFRTNPTTPTTIIQYSRPQVPVRRSLGYPKLEKSYSQHDGSRKSIPSHRGIRGLDLPARITSPLKSRIR